ncbi:glutathione S-transferase, partial [Crucibulum laeve]
ESRAIGHCIAAKCPSQSPALVPNMKDLQAAASVEASAFDPYASFTFPEKVFKPHYGGTPDEEVFQGYISKLSAKLDVYEQILAKQKYVAGNEITLADLFHLSYGSMLPFAGSDVIESKPHVASWFKEISARPSWQAVAGGVSHKSS